MGFPLTDITIYYNGQVIKDTPPDWDFSKIANYIADFYHNGLNGYKPAKTGRICINLGSEKNLDKPNYFGAICTYDAIIDEQKYLSLSKKEKYKFILDLLHSTVSEIADVYHWDQSVFDRSYNHILESDFKFKKCYPEKKSPNKRNIGQVILTKTEDNSILYASITIDGLIEKNILLEKKNWYWFDSVYKLAKSCKWLDGTSFGFSKGEKKCYYSTESKEVISDLLFDNNNL